MQAKLGRSIPQALSKATDIRKRTSKNTLSTVETYLEHGWEMLIFGWLRWKRASSTIETYLKHTRRKIDFWLTRIKKFSNTIKVFLQCDQNMFKAWGKISMIGQGRKKNFEQRRKLSQVCRKLPIFDQIRSKITRAYSKYASSLTKNWDELIKNWKLASF